MLAQFDHVPIFQMVAVDFRRNFAGLVTAQIWVMKELKIQMNLSRIFRRSEQIRNLRRGTKAKTSKKKH